MPGETNTPDDSTVLVVDDNRPLADGFARILWEDFEVLTAYSAADAMELLDASVDVVILDRRLPDTTGDALLDRIRDADFDCRVAMVSAADPSPGLDCDTYLTKPIGDSEVLHETVTELADGHETSR
ncbi:response regulator [Halorussus salilacus]|uniref:response regulator n=1 Tax=Halorussus salilacus TaxID=2953750 RepID=UPI00209E1545|nr:response regulator [Halorussus salilacus]USZ67241.1 response regulator [Halorussus salilacus]